MSVIARPKQVIRDYCRHKHCSGPIYFLVHEEKIDLHKYYTVQLSINGRIVSQGVGLSRRIAEFKAALNAIHILSQSDPSVLDYVKTDRYGRTINRSFSVDYISNANRNPLFSSQIEAIDSLGIKSDLISSSNNVHNNNHRNDGETSSDEGVSVEGSESSSSAVPSPKLQIKTQSSTASSTLLHDQPFKRSDSKAKFNFLSSLILLNSLRAISRRSFRRKSSFNSGRPLHNADGSTSNGDDSSRPTSSSSASSSSSTSSAFSSNSSLSSNVPSSLSNGHHHHHQQQNEEESLKLTEDTLVNPGLITQSIIEEDEEEDSHNNNDNCNNHKNHNNVDERNHNRNINNNNHSTNNILNDIGQMTINENNCAANGSSSNMSTNGSCSSTKEYRLLRSLSSSYPLSNVCSHNHFSIYGPILCNSTTNCSIKSQTLESSPSAALLRYCVRMYLPLPYYDIRFDQQFMVTCRVMMSTTENCRQPIRLPEQYLNHEFTAKGSGEILRTARNMAAKKIIEKLKSAQIYYEE